MGSNEGSSPNGGRISRRHLVAAFATVALGATASALVSSQDKTLIVADADSGERLLEIPVEDGDTVVLSYTHSVEKTPVRDVYVIEGAGIRMDRMEFSSFGAGLPTDDVERTADGYVVERDDQYEQLSVAPSEIAGHELVVEETRYDLVDAADGSVFITVSKESSILSVPGLGDSTVDTVSAGVNRSRG